MMAAGKEPGLALVERTNGPTESYGNWWATKLQKWCDRRGFRAAGAIGSRQFTFA
jgi:hypothetical protein